ncbi:peamaclein-like [Euphorbia lathyris]|uniref:peamaclein-like n=1 Tax=Euphorbia lathyris TaxID=212925 RepID=UPI003313362F
MRPLFLALLLCSLLFTSSFLLPLVLAQSYDGAAYCDEKCKGRCAKAGVKDRCMKYCGICCAECKCVPSGTYGNKHQCPCYRDKKSNKGKPKCP